MHLIGERYRDALTAPLAALGADVLWLPDNADIDSRLAGHADLSVFSPGGRTTIVARGIYSYIVNILTNRGYSVLPAGRQGSEYPADAGLCVCCTGKYTIYSPRTVDDAVRPFLTGTRIAVAQGYTKCSVCVVSNDAVITSDSAIGSRAVSAGMDALLIEPGHIILDGFDHGFIGGASFKTDDTHMAFTGTLDAHPDKDRIIAFLDKHGLEPVFLTQRPIFDIGGAVTLP